MPRSHYPVQTCAILPGKQMTDQQLIDIKAHAEHTLGCKCVARETMDGRIEIIPEIRDTKK